MRDHNLYRFNKLAIPQESRTVDEWVAILDSLDFWLAEDLEDATLAWKKSEVRRLVRSVKDEDGWPLFSSITVGDNSGQPKRLYVPEPLLDAQGWRQTFEYHHRLILHHTRRCAIIRSRARTNVGIRLSIHLREIQQAMDARQPKLFDSK